jgi:hypothetical protein
MDTDRDSLGEPHPGEDRVDGRDALTGLGIRPDLLVQVRESAGPMDVGEPLRGHDVVRGTIARSSAPCRQKQRARPAFWIDQYISPRPGTEYGLTRQIIYLN